MFGETSLVICTVLCFAWLWYLADQWENRQ